MTDCEQEQKYTDTTCTQNLTTVGVVFENKKIRVPQTYCLHIQQEQEYTGFTEIMIVIPMEDNDDWLSNNKTWKKWTRLGDGGSLLLGIVAEITKLGERVAKNTKLNYRYFFVYLLP